MDKYQYLSVNSLLAKFHRDFRGLDINETDAIEWIGDALGFMKVASASEEAICFMEVKDYQAVLPNGLHYIIQVAKNNDFCPQKQNVCPQDVIETFEEEEVVEEDCTTCGGGWIAVDRFGIPIFEEPTYYRPYFDLQGEYFGWKNSSYYKQSYTPVKLSNHTFFNSLVCQDPDDAYIYNNRYGIDDEYTIVGGNTLRFSFQEGFVAVAYLRQKLDEDGYPMIPDNAYAKNAITYYLTWMVKQRECFMHREGACQLAEKAQAQWNDYILKFKNNAKMPHGLDQHQNLLDKSTYLIPRRNQYFSYFGKTSNMNLGSYNGLNRFGI